MKIQKINIKNFKGLRDVEAQINGNNVYLVGGNGVGKSSFIDAVWVGLTGGNIPKEPTTNGAKKGLIEIDLGHFIARTKFTAGKPTKFELENKNFEKDSEKFIRSPRTYLNNKIGVIDFDIADFFNKTDAEKLKYLAKIMNVDFDDIDADIEEAMESRKFDKKTAATLQPVYWDEAEASKDLIDVVELSKKIAVVSEEISEFNRIQQGLRERNDRISELTSELERIQKEYEDGHKWLESNKPDFSRYETMQRDLENANEINEKISEARKGREIDEKLNVLNSDIEAANEDIKKLREDKAKRISESINVPNLVYNVDKEEFLYKGLPFDKNQQNTADQLIAGMHIASTLFKELRILKVDGSLIDKTNFKKVLDWAKESDIELFIELVNRDATQLQINVDHETKI